MNDMNDKTSTATTLTRTSSRTDDMSGAGRHALARIRTGVRAVLVLAVAASVAANVLHAQPNAVGRAIAAWSPLALLLTVELISRVPVNRRWLSIARMAATATIAGIAAWVSYWHMVSVAIRYGEGSTSAHLLPLSVDGLVVVASISLVEIAGRLRATDALGGAGADAERVPAQASVPAHPEASADGTAADTAAGPADAGLVPSPPAAARPARASGSGARGPVGPRTALAVTVTRLAAAHPDWDAPRIAARAGCSVRTVRRHLAGTNTGTSTGEVARAGARGAQDAGDPGDAEVLARSEAGTKEPAVA